jgi:phenylacetate-CoA ligase
MRRAWGTGCSFWPTGTCPQRSSANSPPFPVSSATCFTASGFLFLLDKPANVLEFVYYWRHWSWAGYRLGDRFAELSNSFFLRHDELAGKPAHLQKLSGRLLLNSLALSPENVPAFALALRRHRPRFLKGLVSSLYYLALCFKERGITDFSVRGIFSTGEMLAERQRQTIEQVFNTKVYDSYGHMERTVAISQCPHGGFHINPEYGILELVDRRPLESQEPATPGSGGRTFTARVVGTSLHNLSMPLLRYDVGDSVEIREGEEDCPCGRAMPRVHRILGRQEDVIVRPDGKIVTGLFLVWDQVPGIAQGQVIQEAMNRLRVRVVRSPDYSTRSEDDLLLIVRRFVGPAMRIKVEYVSRQALREHCGKFQTVVSLVAQNATRELHSGVLS